MRTDESGNLSRWRRRLAYAGGVVGGVLGLLLVLPRISGAPWRAVASTLGGVPPGALVLLLVLWAAGLLANTLTLTAALPGLSHRRALLLSLTGSAVANVLPIGGAAGVALNHRMTRRWGFSPSGIASYIAVTNVWDVLGKLVLPVIVLPLVVTGIPVGAGWIRTIAVAAVALPVVAGAAVLLLVHPGVLARLGSRVEQGRTTALRVVAAGWRRLSTGSALYLGLLFVLLLACLHVTGAAVPWNVVLVAFCVERLATLVGLTPGGLGVVEAGLAGALMLAPGASPAGVAAGVLVYRTLTFGLEIPVGGLLLAGWTWRQRVAT